jgi:hypothetical protein
MTRRYEEMRIFIASMSGEIMKRGNFWIYSGTIISSSRRKRRLVGVALHPIFPIAIQPLVISMMR